MAKNHIQDGDIITWANATGSDVVSGQAFVVGTLMAVATGNIANGKSGEVAIGEVWEIPKEAPLAISQGDAVYYVSANKNVNKTSAGNTFAGHAVYDAASAATTVKVLLNV